MSFLYVTGYRWQAYDRNMSPMPYPATPSWFEWKVPIKRRLIVTDSFPAETRFIEIVADTDCWLAIDDKPEANVGFHPVLAKERLIYGVTEGHKLSVIQGDDE